MKELLIVFGLAAIALIPLGIIIFILSYKIEKSNIKHFMKQGFSKEEAKKLSRMALPNKPAGISEWESSRIRAQSRNLGISPEAIILYEQLTGQNLTSHDSFSIKSAAKAYNLSDVAVVLKQYGGR